MCGIAGIFHQDHERPIDRSRLRDMTDALSHRGPDGEGYFVDRNVGLGHRRLAIIDLATGDQPMFSADGNLVVVFNGEIYNYLELKHELEALGHHFVTSSDTEVILSAYQQWGFDCQQKLNGMWAFALWDARQRQLFISRDRIGEKPLHYSFREGTFLFGSEIKSILAYGLTYRPANELLHVYLSLGYVPAPHTFFSGISKLMAGQFLIVKDNRVQERTYWDLPPITERDMRTDARRVCDEFQEYFLDSVKIRMRSDVPFGAFLSGGLDSSSIVAAMSAETPSPVETFTIGFSDKAFDERRPAREVSDQFHTHHHEQVAEPGTFDESLKKVLAHFDEPFGDASAIPVGLVSRLARQQVTMVLTGDGGDEILSGYTSYVTERLAERYRAIPAVLRRGIHQSTTLLSRFAKSGLRYRLNRAGRFMGLADASFDQRFISKLSMLSPDLVRSLIPHNTPQMYIEDYLSNVFAKCALTDPFYRLMYFHLKVSLPDDMLAKVDRMSMAYSLEARVPFLDHRLIELMYCAHKDVKMPSLDRKHVLKQTIGPRLPSSLLNAPKMPFSVPLREWFKQEGFTDRLQDLERSDFGLDRAVIRKIVEANRNGSYDYGDFIWRLFVLKDWTTQRSLIRKPESAVPHAAIS